MVGAVAVGVTACSGSGDPAEYPQENITVVVPVPAGSSTDLSTRIVTPCLEEELDTSIQVENREGGSGAVGNTYFSQSEPDGYTLVSTTAANAVLPPLLEDSVEFDADSFRPVGTIGQAPIVMVTREGEYDSAEELLTSAEGSRTVVGVPGATSVPAIVVDGLIATHDVGVETVPFDGNGNTLQALRAGDVDAIFVSADSGVTLPALEEGGVEALATAVTEPAPHLPDVPTLDSLGYSDLPYADSFWFLATQPDTPDEIANTLESAMQTCMSDSDVQDQLGEGVAPPEFVGAEETNERLHEAAASYAEVAGD